MTIIKLGDKIESNRLWLADKEWPELVAAARESLLQAHVVNLDDCREKFEVAHGKRF